MSEIDNSDIVPAFEPRRGEVFALADSVGGLAQRWIDNDVEISAEQCDNCGCAGYTLGRKQHGTWYVVCSGDDLREGCGTEYPVRHVEAREAIFNW